MEQPINVNHGIGDQNSADYGVGSQRIMALQQVSRNSSHEQNQKREPDQEESLSGKMHAGGRGKQQSAGDERCCRAEEASALPDEKRHERYHKQQQQADSVLQEKRLEQRGDGLPRDVAAGNFEPLCVGKRPGEGNCPEAIDCPQQEQSSAASGSEDGNGGAAAHMTDPEH